MSLRGIYGAIRDGEATWQTVMQNKADMEGNGTGAGNGVGGTLPVCTAEQFEKKSAEWRPLIASGKKPVNALIAMIQTKMTLTEDQKVEIASWASTNGENNADA